MELAGRRGNALAALARRWHAERRRKGGSNKRVASPCCRGVRMVSYGGRGDKLKQRHPATAARRAAWQLFGRDARRRVLTVRSLSSFGVRRRWHHGPALRPERLRLSLVGAGG